MGHCHAYWQCSSFFFRVLWWLQKRGSRILWKKESKAEIWRCISHVSDHQTSSSASSRTATMTGASIWMRIGSSVSTIFTLTISKLWLTAQHQTTVVTWCTTQHNSPHGPQYSTFNVSTIPQLNSQWKSSVLDSDSRPSTGLINTPIASISFNLLPHWLLRSK